MSKYFLLILSLIFMSIGMAFGVDVVEPAIPGNAFFDSILSFLESAGGQSVVVAMVLEFILRMVKSEKPLSILYVVSGTLKKVGQVFSALGNFLDKVLPQKLK